MSAALEINNLVVRYGTNEAVSGLTLECEAGAVTAIVGPNGAGKTTTVETCEGYRRPYSGSVRVLGLDPVNWLGDTRWALLAVVVVDVWHWTPFVFLLLLAGLQSLPQDVHEAAEVDGAQVCQTGVAVQVGAELLDGVVVGLG